MKSRIVALVMSALLLISAASGEAHTGDPVLITLKGANANLLESVVSYAASSGGRIVHIYPPHVLIGFLPRGAEGELEAKFLDARCFRGEITGKPLGEFGETFAAVFEAWNNNFQGKATARGLNPSPGEYTPSEPIADALAVPRDAITGGGSAMSRPQGAGYYDVSEYLYGRISVNVILPESDGSIDTQTENWTSTKEQQVVSEIQQGLSWLSSQDSRANLSFVYNFYYGRTDTRARTGYEPIGRPHTDQSLWMNQIMANFGNTTGSEFDRTFAFLNSAIWGDNADWGVLIWVVDSEVDGDGRFTDSWFAYAYLGGPFLVMTYDNAWNGSSGWGIGKMDAVVSHEFEHNFHALDEYADATNQPCTMYSGYLNVQNRNSANYSNCGSDLNLSCVMRSGDNVSGICTYTRQMLGWRDNDANNIFDVADTYPATTLNPLVPNPTYDKTPTFTGSGADVALTNLNPYPFGHFGPRNNISPNPVNQWWWRVDAGSWNVWYGEYLGPMTTSPLPNGSHSFEFKARNALGRFDQTPELQNFIELGHLYSTTSVVTAANSQRRIARDETGTYHVAYSDENIIYYTSSTNNGATWSTEEVIPAPSFFPKNYPAVATHLSHVFIVWQEYEGVVNGKHQYRINGVWKQPGSAWRQMRAYGSSTSPLIARFSSPNDPLPTLVAADNTYNERSPSSPPHPELMCAWRNEDGIYSALGSWDVIPSCCGPGDGADEILSQEYVWNPYVRFGKISGTSGYCVNPSLGTDFASRVGLAYDEAGIIYATLNDGAGWSAREQVSLPPLTSEPSHYPSATFDNSSRMIVTWKSEDWDLGQDIEVRRRETSGGWNVITMFGEMHSYYPSISGYPRLSGNSDFAVAFHTSQNNLQLKKYTNGAWQTTQVVATPGFDAMISENNSASLDAKIAFRGTSSAPYALGFTSQSLPTSPYDTQEDIYREVRVAADSFAIRFVLGELIAKTGTTSAPVSFDAFDDTTVVRGNTEITRVLRSEQFDVSAGTVLEVFQLLRVSNASWIRNTFGRNSEVALSIEAVDARTGTVLGKPATFSVTKNVIPSLRGNATIPLSPFRGRRIFVRASVQISSDLITRPYVLEIRKPQSTPSAPLARNGDIASIDKPLSYFLAESFPNPFNPSTSIQFGLPEAAVVSLSVFDVLGREIQQLASGYYSAGYHTLTWNASDLSSGVYFARLRVTDAAGKQFFTKTSRLLLAK